MEGGKMTLNLIAAAEKMVLQRGMFPVRGFFMPLNSCLSPWAPWDVPVSKPASCKGWGEEVAQHIPVMHLAPAAMDSAMDKKSPWHALGKQGEGQCPTSAGHPC